MLDENTKIDFKKLHKALSDTYKRQMEIKKEFPHRFEYPTYDWNNRSAYKEEMERRKPWQKARQEFSGLSSRMTMLCCIINHAKGKLHMTQYDGEEFTREDQEGFIWNDYKEFELDEIDEFGVSKADDDLVDRLVSEHTQEPKRKGIVARFAEALGL